MIKKSSIIEDFYNTLKPETFVGVRTLPGGPAPETMKAALEKSKVKAKNLYDWIHVKETNIIEAEKQLAVILEGWNQ